MGAIGTVLYREVVPFSEEPLLEVPLYYMYILTSNVSSNSMEVSKKLAGAVLVDDCDLNFPKNDALETELLGVWGTIQVQ